MCSPLHHVFFNSYSIKNSSSNNELIFSPLLRVRGKHTTELTQVIKNEKGCQAFQVYQFPINIENQSIKLEGVTINDCNK